MYLDVSACVMMFDGARECNVARAGTLAVVEVSAVETIVRLLVAVPVLHAASNKSGNTSSTVDVGTCCF